MLQSPDEDPYQIFDNNSLLQTDFGQASYPLQNYASNKPVPTVSSGSRYGLNETSALNPKAQNFVPAKDTGHDRAVTTNMQYILHPSTINPKRAIQNKAGQALVTQHQPKASQRKSGKGMRGASSVLSGRFGLLKLAGHGPGIADFLILDGKRASLADFPRELRDEIYGYMLPSCKLYRSMNPSGPNARRFNGWYARELDFDPNLLKVSKQVRREALDLIYRTFLFVFPASQYAGPLPRSLLFYKTVRRVEMQFSEFDASKKEPEMQLHESVMRFVTKPNSNTVAYEEDEECYIRDQIEGSRYLRTAWDAKIALLNRMTMLKEVIVNVETCFWRDGKTHAGRAVYEMIMRNMEKRESLGLSIPKITLEE